MIPPTYSNKERLVTKRLVQSVNKLVYSPYPILNVYYLEKYYLKVPFGDILIPKLNFNTIIVYQA